VPAVLFRRRSGERGEPRHAANHPKTHV